MKGNTKHAMFCSPPPVVGAQQCFGRKAHQQHTPLGAHCSQHNMAPQKNIY
jgi:hypothetical protein